MPSSDQSPYPQDDRPASLTREESIRQIVENFPPLTPAQREAVAALGAATRPTSPRRSGLP